MFLARKIHKQICTVELLKSLQRCPAYFLHVHFGTSNRRYQALHRTHPYLLGKYSNKACCRYRYSSKNQKTTALVTYELRSRCSLSNKPDIFHPMLQSQKPCMNPRYTVPNQKTKVVLSERDDDLICL